LFVKHYFCTLVAVWLLAVAALAAASRDARAACANPDAALGVSRIVEIDATNGPMFGTVTRQAHEPSFLKPNEVVLTFDDGPMPWVTKSILDTLDRFCTKATFFSVGQMALAYPASVREVVARGHTLGSHTYTHPFNMPRMKFDAATSEIEHGIAAVSTAAGTPIAPFFRFTGLSDSVRLLDYLQTRGVATFTVDVVSNDSYIHDPAKLTERTMAEVHQQHGGIILFHDIKTTTAKALPAILARLKAEGYSVVHLTAKRPVEPQEIAMRDVAPKLSTAHNGEKGGKTMLPFYGAVGPDKATTPASLEVTSVAPPARPRAVTADEQVNKVSRSKSDVPTKRHAAGTKVATAPSGWMKSSITEMTGPPVIFDAMSGITSGWTPNVRRGKVPRRTSTSP
jgi:peptidoglycan/xylan/chitin deacetylase (PgdA/CDA1 family)